MASTFTFVSVTNGQSRFKKDSDFWHIIEEEDKLDQIGANRLRMLSHNGTYEIDTTADTVIAGGVTYGPGSNTLTVYDALNPFFHKASTGGAGGGGATPTLQAALDAGKTLNKDNDITTGFNQLFFTSGDATFADAAAQYGQSPNLIGMYIQGEGGVTSANVAVTSATGFEASHTDGTDTWKLNVTAPTGVTIQKNSETPIVLGAGGGGGSTQVDTITKYVDVHITDAQLKTLKASPIQVLPDISGDGITYAFPHHSPTYYVLDTSNGAYAMDSSTLSYRFGSTGTNVIDDVLANSGQMMSAFVIRDMNDASLQGDVTSEGSEEITDNSLWIVNIGENEIPGGGTGNSLSIRIYYTIVPIGTFSNGSSNSSVSSTGTLASPDGSIWGLSVNDSGAIMTTKLADSGEGGIITLHAPDATEWNLTISNSGVLSTTQI